MHLNPIIRLREQYQFPWNAFWRFHTTQLSKPDGINYTYFNSVPSPHYPPISTDSDRAQFIHSFSQIHLSSHLSFTFTPTKPGTITAINSHQLTHCTHSHSDSVAPSRERERERSPAPTNGKKTPRSLLPLHHLPSPLLQCTRRHSRLVQ
jgi:hypothetical protein